MGNTNDSLEIPEDWFFCMIINKELYQQIVQVIPIACVDLVVVDDVGQVLLAKRTNEPAIGEWW